MFPRRAAFLWPLTSDDGTAGDDGDDGDDGAAGGAAADTFNDGADGDGKANGGKADGGDGKAAEGAQGLRAEISPPAGDGDGGGEAGDGKGAGGDGDGDGAAGGKPQALTFEKRPDWLPEQFHDGKSGEVKVEDMAKAWTGMRAKVSTGDHKAPKEASGYKLEAPETAAAVMEAVTGLKNEDGSEGPILEWFRTAAHEAGLSQDAAQTLYEGYLEQVGATLPEPMDTKAELAKLGPKGQEILDGSATHMQGLKDKGVWNDEQLGELMLTLDTAVGVSAWLAYREYAEGLTIPDMLTSQATGSVSADELRAEQAVVMELAAKGDPTAERKARELEKKYEQLYGTEPAGSSARPAV